MKAWFASRIQRRFGGRQAVPVILLASILAAHLACNVIWLRSDCTLRADDQGTQMVAVAHAHRLVTTQGLTGVVKVLRGRRSYGWPSASTLPWVATSLFFGHSLQSLRLYNILVLGLLLVAVYRIGRRRWGVRAGLLAAALVSLYPAIYGTSRQFGADLPATAMVALCVDALLATGRFQHPVRSLFLGLFVGLGLLVRPHLLFYCAGPLVLELVRGLLRPGAAGRLRILIHAAAAGVVAALVSSWWWFGRVGGLLENLGQHRSGEVDPHKADELLLGDYLQGLPAGASVFLLLVAGLAAATLLAARLRRAGGGVHPRGAGGSAGRSSARADLLPLLVWLVAGLAVTCSNQHFRLRYLWPLLPPLALLTAAGLLAIPPRAIRRAVVSVTLATASVSWLLCSFVAGADRGGTGPDTCQELHLCGRWEESGPPGRDGSYLAAQRVAARLRRDHLDHDGGRGMILKLEPLDFVFLHPLVVATAVLRFELPRLVVTGLPLHQASPLWSDGEDPLHLELGGVAFEREIPSKAPTPRCYTLRITTPRSAAGLHPLANAQVLLQLHASSRTRPVTLTLYRHLRCPTG